MLDRITEKEPFRTLYTIGYKVYKFFDDDLTYFAASLSFYTIFAFIPILLIAFSIFTNIRGFEGYFGEFKNFLFSNLIPTHTDAISVYIDSFIANSLNIGAIGVVYILVTSVLFFKNYEFVVSRIFRSRKRGFWLSVSTYWTLITLMPVGIMASIYASGYIQIILPDSVMGEQINFILLMPYVITWLLFFSLFRISANREVGFLPAFYSSLIVSTLWSVSKAAFIFYVLNTSAVKSIYGSFSAILFFFLWIYYSWIIFLYGMKICRMIEISEQKKKRRNSSQIIPSETEE